MSRVSEHPSGWFKRFLLPGLGVKAVVIGGGYATGRELAEFFLSRGPWGGLFAILFATLLFSIFCPLTFVIARRFGTYDYRSFFKRLLGPAWPLFELAYLLFVVLILAVYGAAAGAIGTAVFGVPEWVGTVALMAGIAGVVAFGNKAVERLFRDVSYYLYGIYAVFIVVALWKFGAACSGRLRRSSANLRLGALRPHLLRLQHHRRSRDPARASPPHQRPRRGRVGRDRGPADDASGFALLHPDGRLLSGSAERHLAVRFHAPAHRHSGVPPALPGDDLSRPCSRAGRARCTRSTSGSTMRGMRARADRCRTARASAIALVLLVGCMFLASRFGLVALIANGYRALAYILLATYILPLVTIGVWKLWRTDRPRRARAASLSSNRAPGVIRMKLAAVFAAGAVASALFATSVDAAPPAGFEQRVEQLRKQFGVPGVSIAIVEDGKVTLAHGWGVRDIGTNKPVDADTIFFTGSTGKAFTNAALATLVDEGKIKWDDKVIDHMPDFRMWDPWVTREMTIRDLLVHRSGLGLGEGDLLFLPNSTLSRKETVRRIRYLKPATSFRSGYAYDNILYMAAGQLIEEVSGETLGAVHPRPCLRPLGMNHSTDTDAEFQANPNHARPHSRNDWRDSRSGHAGAAR